MTNSKIWNIESDALKSQPDFDLLLSQFDNTGTLILVSSLTDVRELLVELSLTFYEKRPTKVLLQKIKTIHTSLLSELSIDNQDVQSEIHDMFVEIDWLLEDDVQDSYEYIHDQIVSIGELVSSKILYYYCQSNGIKAKWLDGRDVIITDNQYTNVGIIEKETQSRIENQVKSILNQFDVIITQNSVGCSTENYNTTFDQKGKNTVLDIYNKYVQ
ncbi:MAG: hypothetical protein V3V14_09110 [Saprospiraceae bacterium]